MAEPQELFRVQPTDKTEFSGSDPITQGIQFIGNIGTSLLNTANRVVDPLLDFERSRRELELLEQNNDLAGTQGVDAKKVTGFLGLDPDSIQIPKAALLIGGGLTAIIVLTVIIRRRR